MTRLRRPASRLLPPAARRAKTRAGRRAQETGRRRRSITGSITGLFLLLAIGCAEQPEARTRIAEVEATIGTGPNAASGPSDVPRGGSLARAAGGPAGTDYRVQAAPTPGVVLGTISGGSPKDTSITPTHDLAVCRPFSETLVLSREGGVGDAVVWLSGVDSGPRDDAPRRVRLTLDGCRLSPRVQRIAAGSTVLVNSRDAMMSRLQFTANGEAAPRATLLLSDAGQVVPTAQASAAPGLVRVSDDMHPWVRAWLVVAPHPFVAVTAADGNFRFDGVPPGRYTLHVWHERLGTRDARVRVDGGVQTRLQLAY